MTTIYSNRGKQIQLSNEELINALAIKETYQFETNHPEYRKVEKHFNDVFMNWVYEVFYVHNIQFFKSSEDGNSFTLMNNVTIRKSSNGELQILRHMHQFNMFQDSPALIPQSLSLHHELKGLKALRLYNEEFDAFYEKLSKQFVLSHDLSVVGIENGCLESLIGEIDDRKPYMHGNKGFANLFTGASYNKLKNTVFGMPFNKISKCFFKTFYAWLDPQVLTLANKISTSFDVSYKLYNFSITHEHALEEMIRIQPNLLPFAYVTFITDIKELKTLLRTQSYAKESSKHARMFHYPSMKREELTEAGWRWLIKQKPSINGLIAKISSLDAICKTVNMLAKAKVMHPNYYTLANNMGHDGVNGEFIRDVLARSLGSELISKNIHRFIKIVYEEADVMAKRGKVKQFVKNELMFAMDFILNTGFARLSGDFSWNGIMRRQEYWHHQESMKQISKNPYKWTSLINTALHSKVSVKALNSSQELVDEGFKMHHCVGSYSDKCAEGESRVFQVFDEQTQTYSTLELKLAENKGNWKLNQIRSAWNKKVDERIIDACKDFTKTYNKAWYKLNKVERENALLSEKTSVREVKAAEVEVEPLFLAA